MAKERLINTRFWNDSWIRKLNPLDRYLFIYLLTNERTNISGIYELPLTTMAYDTGIDERDLKNSMLPKLIPKVYYKKEWVILTNFIKYQHTTSDAVVEGIRKSLLLAPKEVLSYAKRGGYGEGMGRVWGLSYIPNLNLNLNNTDFSLKEKSPLIELTQKKKSSLKDKTKKMKTYNENNFSDSEDNVIDSDSGEIRGTIKKQKEKTEGKNKIAIRIQQKFSELCKKNIGTTPILNIVSYKQSLFALNSGSLSEEIIYDLFDEWFTLPDKKDEQLISITQALSTFNINSYKIRNKIK